MEVVICDTADQVGEVAAGAVADAVRRAGRRDVVLGVATGSSPLSTYEHLAAMVEAGQLDLSAASAFALDEYVGLPKGHPQSYAAEIDRRVTGPLGLDSARVHVPDGSASDIAAAAHDFEQAMADAGGVDVQVLGIGTDGHIGFNEPGSSMASRTRIKTLTASTRRDNARFFDSIDDVPQHCLTQGIATIMEHRRIVLVATGNAKADAVAAMVEGPVTASCPASVLQFHPSVVIVVDADAAAKLQRADYYREVYDNKPDWQRFA